MALFRPAGLSDESDSDYDYGYCSNIPRYNYKFENAMKRTEDKLQDAIRDDNIEEVANIVTIDLNNNVDARLDSGWTPLLHACYHAKENVVNFLLNKGADPNLQADSITPIMMACSNTTADENTTLNVVNKLIQCNSILNIGDKYGQTPLMRAVSSGRTSVVKLILEKDINIEMRDRQGWTAVFCAIHCNQAECLNILLEKGARLNLVDSNNTSPLEIANTHDYPDILRILEKYLNLNDNTNVDQNETENVEYSLTDWLDYYPGCKTNDRPKYLKEINNLLYGMNCDRLQHIFRNKNMDLRTFLLLEEEDMIKLGIDMPFERQRLRYGLRCFHTKSWKINAVAGLYSRRKDSYSVLECLSILGNHLQQLYILEATLTYTLREYARIQHQLKFEPPDSPVTSRLQEATSKMISNINNLRKEIVAMKKIHNKINKQSLKPADLIRVKSTREIAQGYLTELVIMCSLGLLAYHSKSLFMKMLKQ